MANGLPLVSILHLEIRLSKELPMSLEYVGHNDDGGEAMTRWNSRHYGVSENNFDIEIKNRLAYLTAINMCGN